MITLNTLLPPSPLRMEPADAQATVRAALLDASAAAVAGGMPALEARGQLIRPLVAYAAALGGEGEEGLTPAFWQGVLAVQLAHEASLVHDDVVDGASFRRGEPTLVASAGVARALVQGDHLLTASYRAAAATRSLSFITLFARAVERTVAGEIAQGRTLGTRLDSATYREIALGKAGELLGCALATSAAVAGRPWEPLFELGRRLGLLYQMVDDLLDYCPGAGTGKDAMGDFVQRRWTWPLEEVPGDPFGHSAEELALALRRASGGQVALLRCLERVRAEGAALLTDVAHLLPNDSLISGLVTEWVERAAATVETELHYHDRRGAPAAPPVASPALRSRVPATPDAIAFLGANSRTFRVAARLLPRAQREQVARVYAFCRITDDLVDQPAPGGMAEASDLLAEWLLLSQRAYAGERSGIDLLDRVMAEMAAARVPFDYAAELAEGMRMDLRGERYPTLDSLRVYTHRAASVVGLWLTRLFGTHDPLILEDAACLGHAMQLTNIVRDVGDDLRSGRLYLPGELLRRHGVEESHLIEALGGRRHPGPAYSALLDELMDVADADYARAFAAIPALPPFFQRPVAVAARLYQGIHGAVRRNGYDNLRLRAYTSVGAKAVLGGRAIWELRGTAAR